MSADDFLVYMTKAKGIFFSKTGKGVEKIEIIEDNDNEIVFRVTGVAAGAEKQIVAKVTIRKVDKNV